MQELFDVGLWMRQHYSNFLPLKYDGKDIYVQSIDFDRCLMSAAALLAALYWPVGADRCLDTPWQPVPIHTTPNRLDILLQWTACPYYNVHSHKAAEFQKELSKNNADLFNFIKKATGSPFNLTSTLLLYNVLKGEKMINLTLPLWAHGIIRDIKPLLELSFVIDSMSTKIKKVRSGPLIKRILTQFERAISGDKFGTTDDIYRKMMLYSTADMSAYYLADSLNVENIGIVNYGFSMYFELKEANNGSYFVDIFYRNSTDVNAPTHYTNIKGYQKSLDFDTFKKIAGQIAVNSTEWANVCKKLSSDSSNN